MASLACLQIIAENASMPYSVNLSLLNSTDNLSLESSNIYLMKIQYLCDRVLIPVVLCFGIIGNAISISVLWRKRLRHTFDEVEQSATSGLVCLSLSDLAFCSIGFVSVILPSNYTAPSHFSYLGIISIYYYNLRGPLLNIFLLTSTWLVIVISIARYVAIADPFNAQTSWMVRYKNIVYGSQLFVSIVINFPQFLQFQIKHKPCYGVCFCYFREPWIFPRMIWYHIVWHIVGTILPLLILVYCNGRLLHQIYKSLHGHPHQYSTSKITVILVSIITLFLLLVFPSMILTLLNSIVNYNLQLQTAISVTNLMQSINFAVNFVIYSCISKQFRHTFLQTLFCIKYSKRSSAYQMVRVRRI